MSIKKLKKLMLCFVILIFSIILSCCTVDIATHTHTEDEVYYYDNNFHYHLCTVCEAKISTEKHSYSDWTITQEPTESTEGIKERHCLVCGYSEEKSIETLPHTHSWSDYIYNSASHWVECESCDAIKNKQTHTFTEWSIKKEPTLNEDGLTERECTICGYSEEDTIPFVIPLISFNLNEGITLHDTADIKASCTADNLFFDVTKKGYIFRGWSCNGKQIFNELGEFVSLPKTSETLLLDAIFEPIKYSITYELLDGSFSGPNEYTIESEDIVISSPTKTAYDFLGWKDENSETIYSPYTIPLGSTGDIYLTAVYTPTIYTITYNLKNGSCENSTTYTIEDDDIILNSPVLEYHVFLGWTGSCGDTPVSIVTIVSGSYGNLEYTANYKTTEYPITYDYNNGNGENPASYNIDTDSFTLSDPVRDGYTFEGWTGSNGSEPEKVVTIASGSSGELNYTANWKIITYYITYSNIIAEENQSLNNRTKYNIETTTFTLFNPTRENYTFTGWTGSCGNTPVMTMVINTGTFGDLNFIANWTANVHTITYNLDEGTNDERNPSEYSYDQDPFTLYKPTRKGYTFVCWKYKGNEITEIIPTSCIDYDLVAIWKLDKSVLKYTIRDYYDNDYYSFTDCAPSTGNVKFLVIPVWFTDSSVYIKAANKEKVRSDIYTTFFGSNEATGWRSVKTYYEEESSGKLTITGTVANWYSCGNSSLYYYADNTQVTKTRNLVLSATDYYFENNPDDSRSNYDSDGNGIVDAVYLIYACPNTLTLKTAGTSMDSSNMWAYKYTTNTNNPDEDNPVVWQFVWASYDFMYASVERAAQRTGYNYYYSAYESAAKNFNLTALAYIHETGHIFGLNDYYDTENIYSPAGELTMQDASTCSHDPYSYLLLGWADPYIPDRTQTITIGDFQSTKDVILLSPTCLKDGSPFDEYILLELYTPTGLNSYNVGRTPNAVGIRIWHVDARLFYATYSYGEMVFSKLNMTTDPTYKSSKSYGVCFANTNSSTNTKLADFSNYNELQLIRNNTNIGYMTEDIFSEDDLFYEGDSFNVGNYYKQFVHNSFLNNSTSSLRWIVNVDKITNTDGKYEATITVKRL